MRLGQEFHGYTGWRFSRDQFPQLLTKRTQRKAMIRENPRGDLEPVHIHADTKVLEGVVIHIQKYHPIKCE